MDFRPGQLHKSRYPHKWQAQGFGGGGVWGVVKRFFQLGALSIGQRTALHMFHSLISWTIAINNSESPFLIQCMYVVRRADLASRSSPPQIILGPDQKM